MTIYHSYADLEQRYKRDRRTIWRWWAKEGILKQPKKVNGKLLGWTDADLMQFESGQEV